MNEASENQAAEKPPEERWEVSEGKNSVLGAVLAVVVAGECYTGGEAVCLISQLSSTWQKDRDRAARIARLPDLERALWAALPLIEDAEADARRMVVAAKVMEVQEVEARWQGVADAFKAQGEEIRALVPHLVPAGKEGA